MRNIPPAGDPRVIVERARNGNWKVLDISGALPVLVEELHGFDDGPEQAEGLAREYARALQDFNAGRREEHPLGRRAQPFARLAG
jgi:hypothetical protein